MLWLLGALLTAAAPAQDAPVDTQPTSQPPATQPAPATQPVPATQPADGVASPDAIRAALQRVAAATDLDDAVKQRITNYLNEALAEFRSREQWQSERARFEALTASAPEQLAAAQAELEKLTADTSAYTVPDGDPLPQLEQRLQQEEAALAAVRRESEAADERVRTRALRRIELPKLQADVEARLQDLLKAMASATPAEPNPLIAGARRDARQVARVALEEQAAALAAEQRAVAAVEELLAVQSELARARRVRQEARVAALSDAVTQKRKAVAEADKQRAETQAAVAAITAPPAVKALADQAVALQARRQQLLAKVEDAEKRRATVDARLPELEPRLREARETVQNFGLTPAIGYLLRKQQRELDDLGKLRRALAATEQEIASAHFEATLLADQRSELVDLDRAVADAMAELTPRPAQHEREWVERNLRERLAAKRDALTDLSRDLSAYLSAQGRLYTAQKRLLEVTDKFSQFIDEHVLWVRSDTPLSGGDFTLAWQAWSFFQNGAEWQRLLGRAESELRRNPVEIGGALLALVLAFLLRARFKAGIRRIGDQLLRERIATYLPTLQVLLMTSLVAAYWPAIMMLVGQWLGGTPDAADFDKALGSSMSRMAYLVAVSEFFRQVCMHNGLGEAHFGWARGTTRQLRRDLGVTLALGVPLLVMARMLVIAGTDAERSSLGRLLFMTAVLFFSYLVHQLLVPRTGTFAMMFAFRRGGLFDRLRYILYAAGVGAMLGIIVLSITGFQYSAYRMGWCIQATVWLLLGLATMHALLLRWLILAHRRLALAEAEQKAAAARATGEEPPAPAGDSTLAVISHQTQRLVRAFGGFVLLLGLWAIWDNVLPALELLRGVPLWTTITLADLLGALVVALVTMAAARNLPGLLEILVLRHLPFDQGVRYAYTTLSRYLIFVIGMVIAFDFLGIEWGSVQWLVAAVTVGLGFGLQEIFANFVSGIIVLFERPVRVGDIITVGDMTGMVTQIRTRATTIQDGDRKELIVPNRELVTGRILNWTLSDQIVRLTIRVGVAYGTDTRRVRNLLLRLAKENPRVVADPEPFAVFDGFGDSTLDFLLAVFVASPVDLLNVKHSLHTAINDTFAEEGINIAYPQRDVHVHIDNGGSLGELGQSLSATTADRAQRRPLQPNAAR